MIILLGQRTESGGHADVTPELCGFLAYSECNLAIIRAGFAQDERILPFIEYDPQYRPRKFSDPSRVPGRQVHALPSQAKRRFCLRHLRGAELGRVANLGGGASNQLQ